MDRWIADTEPSERFPIYTRANVGEVFPDPVTPLTADTALFDAEIGWRDAWFRMGAFEPDEFPEGDFCQLGVQGGYCYLNASLIRLFGERAPGLSWQAMDEQFFGAQPGIPPYEEMAGDVRPDLSEKIGATFGWVFAQQTVNDLTELTEDKRLTKSLRESGIGIGCIQLPHLDADLGHGKQVRQFVRHELGQPGGISVQKQRACPLQQLV